MAHDGEDSLAERASPAVSVPRCILRSVTDSPHVRTVDGRQVAFGRIPQWDDRNALHLAAPAPQQHPDRNRVMHRSHLPILDQDDVGACEAFQGVDALGCTPLWRGHGQDLVDRSNANDTAFRWYDLLTHDDEFDGAWSYNGNPSTRPHGSGDDTGTSTLALCRMLKQRGLITRYEWITGDDVDLVLHHLDHGGDDGTGTVILTGWPWTDGMTRPDPTGLIRATGPVVGGHATILRGFDRRTRRIRGRNHWTSAWGYHGEYDTSSGSTTSPPAWPKAATRPSSTGRDRARHPPPDHRSRSTRRHRRPRRNRPILGLPRTGLLMRPRRQRATPVLADRARAAPRPPTPGPATRPPPAWYLTCTDP
jgi:hypothetical protein